MLWSNVEAGKINAATLRLWVALGDKADVVARRIISDDGYLAHLASYAINPGFADKMLTSVNPQWLSARRIMGKNFFGVEEAITYFNVTPSEQDIKALAEIPFSETALEMCKDTHILVAVLPISILRMRADLAYESLFSPSVWFDIEDFTGEAGPARWHLVAKAPVARTASKTWEEQREQLEQYSDVPRSRVLVYTMIGYYKTTGNRLFKNVAVRTADTSRSGRVEVEFFRDRIRLNARADDLRSQSLKLASARVS